MTFVPKAADIANKKWYVVDCDGVVLGRLATKAAEVLQGKHKVTYMPNEDMGDYVVVVNAEKIKVTGKKLDQKVYFHHTGWMGGGRYINLRELQKKFPERVVEYAIKGMLPKGPLGRQMYRKLFVYAGPEHKHQAQKPEALKV
ncbi:MAG: 50S ribosomal protein L13 [Lachnospiraceae bacterium]|nr:50S ribosomal protein L13 [Lachnospiraceae bacterium]